MEKFKGKYRITSSRWQNWDYGSNAAYYVTICTQHHVYYFGNIVLVTEKTMQFTQIGSIAHQYWCEIPDHFPFVDLDVFVVMPNHVHGIIVINKPDGCGYNNVGTGADVETRLIASLQPKPKFNPSILPTGGITGDKNPMLYENLSGIIRWYKGRCSFEIHKIKH